MISQQIKAHAFAALHQGPCFIIPNPWDVGSARLLAGLGFPALAGTGAGFAFSRGQPDGAPGRDVLMAHLGQLCAATDLPVSADLENGFGDAPATVQQTLLLAAEAGVVGGSIEDATGRSDEPIYPLAQAVERIRAASEAVRGLPFPFTLTARAENHLYGRNDLADTIARLQAYQEAGADVLFAPGLTSADDIATVARSLDRPLNVIMGLRGVPLNLAQLADLGVRRVSVGGSLARAAYGALLRAGRELREQGSFGYAAEAVSGAEMNALMAAWQDR